MPPPNVAAPKFIMFHSNILKISFVQLKKLSLNFEMLFGLKVLILWDNFGFSQHNIPKRSLQRCTIDFKRKLSTS